ncbi:SnoaL-like domain-containing protein [Neolewinella litorea]|uniref:Nuclear transport factor 2 family protein n=1 Tax=Neolewinella litorea TaxID=2562452 RepID=A0A4S4NI93_9BACT|nr:SnoaL-like domain-containing protein [Neolewinella litorea]THH37928.1 nuclear transport factor 2 family protein [Neolewinella litorea]
MTIQEIADRLVELSRNRQSTQAYRELFARDAQSHEMPGVPDGTVTGLDNLIAKSEAFDEMHREIHALPVTDPLIYQNFFTVGMGIDVTKQDGTRNQAHEICVYQVRDGKIVDERFVYSMPG